jgi:hypothetical protein
LRATEKGLGDLADDVRFRGKADLAVRQPKLTQQRHWLRPEKIFDIQAHRLRLTPGKSAESALNRGPH